MTSYKTGYLTSNQIPSRSDKVFDSAVRWAKEHPKDFSDLRDIVSKSGSTDTNELCQLISMCVKGVIK